MRSASYLTPRLLELWEKHREACEKAGVHILLTDTLRTPGEQKALFAQGRKTTLEVNLLRKAAGMPEITERQNRYTVTKTMKSRHLAGPDGLARAYDVAIRGPLGGLVWDLKADPDLDGKPEWQEVAEIGRGLGLEAGFFWPWRDAPHFQLPDAGK